MKFYFIITILIIIYHLSVELLVVLTGILIVEWIFLVDLQWKDTMQEDTYIDSSSAYFSYYSKDFLLINGLIFKAS